MPILRRAQRAFDAGDMPASEQLRWKWLATVSSVHLWDDARWEALSERHVQIAREAGALGELPLALSQRVYVHLFAGELTAAASLVDEIQAATEATGSNLAPYGAVGLAALRGREAEAIASHRREPRGGDARGEESGSRCSTGRRRCSTTASAATRRRCAAALRVAEYPHDLSHLELGRWSS